MSIISRFVKYKDQSSESLIIKCTGSLNAAEAALIRNEIFNCSKIMYSTIYIDAKDIIEVDLSGINEVIHSYYTLSKASMKMVLFYRRNSVIEKWVETTGLDKFIDTAIIPAN